MLKMLKKLMLINVKFQISILDFNFFHMDPPLFIILPNDFAMSLIRKMAKLGDQFDFRQNIDVVNSL